MRKLRPYQIEAIRYLRKNPRGAALFMEMRLGKTLCSIRYIKQLPGVTMILVVAPYSALSGWKDDLGQENEGAPLYLTGKPAERRETLYTRFKREGKRVWFLINKEGHLTLPEIAQKGWDVIILDESTFIKNPKAKVTKFFTRNFEKVPHKIILSGTPAPEGELDYYSQLEFINPAILGCKNFWQYRLNWFSQCGFEFVIRPPMRKVLSQRLAHHCFFLKRKDVNLDNEQIIEKRLLKMDTKYRKIYDKLENEFIVKYEEIEQSTVFAGVKFGLLRQLCGGFAGKRLISSQKIDTLSDLLKGELKNEQVVIWAWYVHEVKVLAGHLRCPYICGEVSPSDREEFRQSFQKGKFQHLVAQPETWKFGTTLSAASTLVYYSLPEALLTYQQSKDRTLDLSKQNSCLIINLAMEDTVDTDIWESLQRKEDKNMMMRSLINGIRNRTNH
jgi:SNF2 family DNA or RNA helicase